MKCDNCYEIVVTFGPSCIVTILNVKDKCLVSEREAMQSGGELRA